LIANGAGWARARPRSRHEEYYRRNSRSTNKLSRQAPLPSMLIAMLMASNTLVNSALVNWLPWSVDLRTLIGEKRRPHARANRLIAEARRAEGSR
jgi:hypothetical protein